MVKYLVVGCGLSGAVIAERIANQLNNTVTIIDKRDHVAGNCYDYINTETNIRINKYGAHLFHTNNDHVWKYINLNFYFLPLFLIHLHYFLFFYIKMICFLHTSYKIHFYQLKKTQQCVLKNCSANFYLLTRFILYKMFILFSY
jgi:hypothetical protein